MSNLWRELRVSARALLREKVFALAVIVSLGLGIGANTAIFSMINGIVLRPLPAAEPDRLFAFYTTDEKNPSSAGLFTLLPTSLPNYEDYRGLPGVASGLVAYQFAPLTLTGGERSERLFGQIATGNYFSVLGLEPALGRFFRPEEDGAPGSGPVVVLSERAWRERFGGRSDVLGRTLTLNGHSFTVIGVAPPGFTGTDSGFEPELWLPLSMREQVLTNPEWYRERRALFFFVLGRLAPGVGLRQAEAAFQTEARQLAREHPDANKGRSVALVSLPEAKLNPNFRRGVVLGLGMLAAIAGLVLLIACANVANLMLVRGARRTKEVAVRLSLGAGRRAIVRQLLWESLLLGLLGGAAGLLIAAWTGRMLLRFRPPLPIPVRLDVSPDVRVLAFAFLLSLLTALLFGLVPALRSSSPALTQVLKDREPAPAGSVRWRQLLLVFQVALSLLSVVVAGLFVRSLQSAQRIDPGFEARRLAVMSVDLGLQGYDEARGRAFYDEVVRRAAAVPGVLSASLGTPPPLSFGGMRSVFIEGRESADTDGVLVGNSSVDVHYFATLGIPVRRGRLFEDADREGTRRVAVINETMAERFWPGQDPLGRRFRFFGQEPVEVVGVVPTVKYTSLSEAPQSHVYLPLAQDYQPGVSLHVRTAGDPEALLPVVAREVEAIDPGLPFYDVSTLPRMVYRSLWASRMGATLFGTFGLLALVLSAVGIYGTTAFLLSQRTREMGIRMALGARRGQVVGLVVRQGMLVFAVGLSLGLAGALAFSSALARLLVGIDAHDAATFWGTSLVFALVALMANWLPAARSVSLDPMTVLRQE